MADSKDVSIEIGPRETPLTPYLRDDLKGENPLYIDWHRGALIQHISEDEKGTAIHGDALQMPIKNGSVGNVIIANVFGQHGIPNLFRGDSIMDSPQVDISGIVGEISRVVPVGGKAVVFETSTPPDKEKLIDIFQKEGMVVEENYDKGQLGKIFGNDPIQASFGKTFDRLATAFGYALVFKKA